MFTTNNNTTRAFVYSSKHNQVITDKILNIDMNYREKERNTNFTTSRQRTGFLKGFWRTKFVSKCSLLALVTFLLTMYLIGSWKFNKNSYNIRMFYNSVLHEGNAQRGTRVYIEENLQFTSDKLFKKSTNRRLFEQNKEKQRLLDSLGDNISGRWTDGRVDQDCDKVYFGNSLKTIPNDRVAIASFPGSGNTWMRELIHLSTGIWTSSVYYDKSLYANGYYGELRNCSDEDIRAFKVHDIQHAIYHNCSIDKVLLIVRNPFRAVLSEFNRRYGHGHTRLASKELFNETWNSFVNTYSRQWEKQIANWITFCVNSTQSKDGNPICHVTKYEELKEDTVSEIKSVLTFLNMPIDRLKCVANDKNKFLRQYHNDSKSATENVAACQLNAKNKATLLNSMKSIKNLFMKFKLYIEISESDFPFNLPICQS